MRSAADKVINDPPEIRPPVVLYKVIQYIRDCIVDLDSVQKDSPYRAQNPQYMDLYSFVRDRTRSVANDFIIINDHLNLYYIRVI